MPYRRSYRRRYPKRRMRRAVRRPGWTWSNVGSMAKSALKGVSYLKGLVNSELYKHDVDMGSALATIGSSGSVINLVSISEGDSDFDRTGVSVFLRSINGHLFVGHNPNGSDYTSIRLSLVIDKQQVGDTLPGYLDIYSSASPFSHLNAQTVGRFSVIWSRTFYVSKESVEGKMIQINKVLRHHIRFNGSSGSDIQKGGIYFTAVSTASTNLPALAGYMRMSYHDN